ncbi:MAG: tetratricopeptide repeat protein [bacterium]
MNAGESGGGQERGGEQTPPRGALHTVLLCAAACALAAAVYVNTLHGDFIWDDVPLVRDNPYIRRTEHLAHLISKSYYDVFGELSYRPLCTLTYFLDYRLWGPEPAGFHATNTALHVLNTLLLFLLAARLTGTRAAAFTAAAVFAVHPVQTEAVAGITFREDVLCMFFILLAVHFHLNSLSGGRSALRWTAAALVAFALALLSKETAVVLPAVLPALKFISPRPGGAEVKPRRSIAVLAAAALVYLPIRLLLFRNPAEHWVYHGGSLWLTMKLALAALFRYMELIPAIGSQCVLYPAERLLAGGFPFVAGALVLAAYLAVCALTFRNGGLSFGIVWFFAFLLPVANIVPIGVIMAERYLYVPSAGFAVAGALFLESVFLRAGRRPGASWKTYVAAVSLVVFALAALTVYRNRVWRNERVFWRDAASCSPRSGIAHNNLGLAYLNAGELDAAKAEFERAARLASETPIREDRYQVFLRARTNLGIVYARQGRHGDAYREFTNVLAAAPGYPNARLNLAALLFERGDFSRAADALEKVLALEPENLSARILLAKALFLNGDAERAGIQCGKVLETDPGNGEALSLLEAMRKTRHRRDSPRDPEK